MKRFMRELRGDQDFLQRRGKGKYVHAGLLHRGVVSFKADILDGWLYNPPFHKIVFFHGDSAAVAAGRDSLLKMKVVI